MESHVDASQQIGRTNPHPKAELAKTAGHSPRTGVFGKMVLAVLSGGLFGLILSVIVAPGFAIFFAITGAMLFPAGVVAMLLVKSAEPDEYSAGRSRTEAEVREALAEIEAKRK